VSQVDGSFRRTPRKRTLQPNARKGFLPHVP
jgi:hypothetical protein